VSYPKIHWDILAQSIDFYDRMGFAYVEAPWIVSDEAINVTLPPEHKVTRCDAGPLVGSAEQSFIQLALDGSLQPGRYVAATPCFRDDPPDALHQRYFFKVELIEFGKEDRAPHLAVRDMAETALIFFRGLPEGRDAEIVSTPQGLDIELRGIELGSYGHRQHENLYWIYGTGFAEPRFSIAARS
jgi:hypothetical protein